MFLRHKERSGAQTELPLVREVEPDRNLHKGGRSFYFFDFDENIAFLKTPTFLFHKETRSQMKITSREFVLNSSQVGQSGAYAEYDVEHCPVTGSFRCFRDQKISWINRLRGQKQSFVHDVRRVLEEPSHEWKGPSWNCFYHAVFNRRPIALITARGHHPATLAQGIRVWVKEGHLPHEPNYLALYPVSHPHIQRELLGLPDPRAKIPALKQRALRAAVKAAFQAYKYNPHHRFGMSDDDPQNVEWILREMRELKREFSRNSFFVIQTVGDTLIKHEVFSDHYEDKVLNPDPQLAFDLDL